MEADQVADAGGENTGLARPGPSENQGMGPENAPPPLAARGSAPGDGEAPTRGLRGRRPLYVLGCEATGSLTWKVAPPSSPSRQCESSVVHPLRRSSGTGSSPTPHPRALVVTPGSKITSRTLGATPGPVSLMRDQDLPPVLVLGPDPNGPTLPPQSVEGIVHEVLQGPGQEHRASHHGREIGGEVQLQVYAGGEARDPGLQIASKAKKNILQRQLLEVRFPPDELKPVADLLQPAEVGPDLVGDLTLLQARRSLLPWKPQQLQPTLQRGDGRAELMSQLPGHGRPRLLSLGPPLDSG